MARIEDILSDQGGRRRDIRYACEIPATVTSQRGNSPCVIVNLSQGGFSIFSEERLQKGEAVEVAREGDRALRAVVAWVTKTSGESHARLRLQESLEKSWLGDELRELSLKAKESLQRRSSIRVSCDYPARLTHQQETFEVRVVDLGSLGARLVSDQKLPPDTQVVLHLGPLDDLAPVVINAVVLAPREENSGQDRVAFAGYRQGTADDLRAYLNWALEQNRR